MRRNGFGPRLAILLLCVAGACAEDRPSPPAAAQVAASVPIVDMTAEVSRPKLGGMPAVVPAPAPATPMPTVRPVPSRGSVVVSESDVAALRARGLVVPVQGVPSSRLIGSFHEARGSRVHEALDVAAPRGTPVLAADDGTVLKLFTSRGGGLTIYIADRSKRFIYYYAHLDGYAPGLAAGQSVVKGQQIGTVGTTGNADANTPHLHFAILRNDDMTQWWQGTPLDPYPILRGGSTR